MHIVHVGVRGMSGGVCFSTLLLLLRRDLALNLDLMDWLANSQGLSALLPHSLTTEPIFVCLF